MNQDDSNPDIESPTDNRYEFYRNRYRNDFSDIKENSNENSDSNEECKG